MFKKLPFKILPVNYRQKCQVRGPSKRTVHCPVRMSLLLGIQHPPCSMITLYSIVCTVMRCTVGMGLSPAEWRRVMRPELYQIYSIHPLLQKHFRRLPSQIIFPISHRTQNTGSLTASWWQASLLAPDVTRDDEARAGGDPLEAHTA